MGYEAGVYLHMEATVNGNWDGKTFYARNVR